jgi:serine/threonine protein kinase
MLAPNTILQNRYRIVRKLGQGGMGAIYEAIDSRVNCVVALKETLVGSSLSSREAFHREAELLANLRHPALPKVMDYFDEGDGEFLVMEFIPGQDLAQLLTLRDGPFPQLQVIRWAIELLKLLEYLHTHEPPIVHRDIKPSNLKATAQGEIFLLDFGLAKGATGQMLTVETDRSVPGYTPIYAPIEQILGHGTDPRSDLYSLGATLFHLLTGQAPVNAPARFDAVENNLPDPQRSPNQLNLQIASEVAACIQNAMALSRKDRPSTAMEMRLTLEFAAELIADRDTAETALQKKLPTSPEDDRGTPLVIDDDVQFTVYAPQKIKPEKNYTMLAFAHLSKRRDDADEDEPDPIAELKRQVERVLGDKKEDYLDAKDSSSQPVPRGGELTFVPVVKGLDFNPPSRSFVWRKSIHREEFDVRASEKLDGQTLRGSMTVFLGSLVIADVGLTISIDSRATSATERISLDQGRSARRVKQVFACYSHKDEKVVAELAHLAPLFGSRFLCDRTHLEPGEDRREGLQRMIRNADVFQLFWSTNSMRSPETAVEINYAASLGRPGFILPTYWEEPMPRSPAEGLPPPEIDRLHFHRIYPGAISQATFGGSAESRLVILGPAGAEIYIDDERHGSIGSSGRVILKSIATGQHVLRVTRLGYGDDERLIEITDGAAEQVIQTQLRTVHTGALASPAESGEFEVGAPPGSVEMAVEKSPINASFEMSDADAPTGELEAPPRIMSNPPSYSTSSVYQLVVCPSCRKQCLAGMTFCGSCGNVLVETQTQMLESVPQTSAVASPPKLQNYQVPSARKSKWIPVYAAAAMVLFVIVLAPIGFVMIQTRSSSNAPLASSTPSTSNTPLANHPAPLPRASNPNSANSNQTANANRDYESEPDIQFMSLDGGRISLSDFRGRVVLLNIWTTKSTASRIEVPLLNDLQKTLERRGLTVIGLSYEDSANQVRQFQDDIPQNYQIGLGGRGVEAQLPAFALPTSYLIDRRGRVRRKMVGSQSRAAFEAEIEPLLNESP